jgi:hypothetical protein
VRKVWTKRARFRIVNILSYDDYSSTGLWHVPRLTKRYVTHTQVNLARTAFLLELFVGFMIIVAAYPASEAVIFQVPLVVSQIALELNVKSRFFLLIIDYILKTSCHKHAP